MSVKHSFVALGVALMVGSLVTLTPAQQSPAVATPSLTIYEPSFRASPLVVTRLGTGEGETWYQSLEVDIKNVSTRPVTQVYGSFVFPDVPTPLGPLSCPVVFGDIDEGSSDVMQVARPGAVAIAPGQTVTICIPPIAASTTRRYLHDRQIPTPTRARFILKVANYGDGTGWMAGAPYPETRTDR
jgi:hypothetical protein